MGSGAIATPTDTGSVMDFIAGLVVGSLSGSCSLGSLRDTRVTVNDSAQAKILRLRIYLLSSECAATDRSRPGGSAAARCRRRGRYPTRSRRIRLFVGNARHYRMKRIPYRSSTLRKLFGVVLIYFAIQTARREKARQPEEDWPASLWWNWSNACRSNPPPVFCTIELSLMSSSLH